MIRSMSGSAAAPKRLLRFVFCVFFGHAFLCSSSRGANTSLPLIIDQGPVLSDLASKVRLEEVFFAQKSNLENVSTAELYKKNQLYQHFVDGLRERISARKNRFVSNIGKPGTSFNNKWVESSYTRFVLTAVVLRPDRIPFVSGVSCGELRLIFRLIGDIDEDLGVSYRLSYVSPLPFTLMVVYPLAALSSHNCKIFWNTLNSPDKLVSHLSLMKPDRLEFNFQNLRVESFYWPEWGGYAEYLMGVVKIKPTGLTFDYLENQPNYQHLRLDKNLRKEFWKTLLDNSNAILNQHFKLPDQFLTKNTVSVAPHGSFRGENFSAMALVSEFKNEWDAFCSDFAKSRPNQKSCNKSIMSQIPRRLDAMSCTGCHQTRSIAGFHHLGVGPALHEVPKINRLAQFRSNHLMGEFSFRRTWLGYKDIRDVFARPLDGRSFHNEGRPGDLCDANAKDMMCADGLNCYLDHDVDFYSHKIGECRKKKSTCAFTNISSKFSEKEGLVHIANSVYSKCSSGEMCLTPEIGFPEGFCAFPCPKEGDYRHGYCLPVPALDAYNDCREKSGIISCLRDFSRPTFLDLCGDSVQCTHGFVCAEQALKKDIVDLDFTNPETVKRLFYSSGQSVGVCVPPYFLQQINISDLVFSSKEWEKP